jgi:hypothetical protein
MTPQEQLAKLQTDLIGAQARKAAAEAKGASIALDASFDDGKFQEYQAARSDVDRADQDIMRLNDALAVAQKRADDADPRPKYLLMRPTVDRRGELVPAGTVYRFDDVPNGWMVPLNDAARGMVQRYNVRPPVNV